MVNKNKKERLKIFGESIEGLINARIREYVKDFIKQREVVIKRVYNEFNYSLRRVDVAFTDDINQSIPIKRLPVNLPYHVKKDDKVFLFYFDKPTNGWIGNIITYNDIVVGGIINWNDIDNIPTTLEGFGLKNEVDQLLTDLNIDTSSLGKLLENNIWLGNNTFEKSGIQPKVSLRAKNGATGSITTNIIGGVEPTNEHKNIDILLPTSSGRLARMEDISSLEDTYYNKIPILFAQGDNLNNFVNAGYYASSVQSVILSLVNRPSSSTDTQCSLLVEIIGDNNTHLRQTYVAKVATLFHMFQRVKNGTSWSSWKEVAYKTDLPAVATKNSPGIVRLGGDNVDITVPSPSENPPADRYYPVQTGKGQLVVNVPWVDNDTKSLKDMTDVFYSAGIDDGDVLMYVSQDDAWISRKMTAEDVDIKDLSVPKGGTGATTFTQGEVLVGNGTNAISTISREGIDTREEFPPRIGNTSNDAVAGNDNRLTNKREPESHASAANTYGLGSKTLYGHVKVIDDLTKVAYADGEALSAYQGRVLKDSIPTTPSEVGAEPAFSVLPLAKGGTGASTVSNARTNLGVPPIGHKSTASTYGVGDGTSFGHVKIKDNLLTSSYVEGNGEALSAYQGKVLKDLIDSKLGSYIQNNINYNTLITTGIYTMFGGANAPNSGKTEHTLVVLRISSLKVQQIAIAEGTKKMYVRTSTGSSPIVWGAWTRTMTLDDFTYDAGVLTINLEM